MSIDYKLVNQIAHALATDFVSPGPHNLKPDERLHYGMRTEDLRPVTPYEAAIVAARVVAEAGYTRDDDSPEYFPSPQWRPGLISGREEL